MKERVTNLDYYYGGTYLTNNSSSIKTKVRFLKFFPLAEQYQLKYRVTDFLESS